MRQETKAAQAEAAVILARVGGHLKKKLFKEQIIICSDSQAAITALEASVTKLLLVAEIALWD